jgi:hypothetical protein
MMVAARPNLGDGEIRELEDLITEYEEVFAAQRGDYGRTDRVYHRIDTERPGRFDKPQGGSP